ncbi:hypothetical protein [Bradyrhizobium arachidis]|uniref:hypothetical protein n=1 Tax=Bradyrhizobium arachidis TaxID=858423 RepID=UPI00216343B7|nr:hypothetical protein [Bradyrhizobium arachidis]UVO28158.1 hypothetical protein KUF59_37760 [Bradyrhizobium arachidis]
MGKAQYRCAGHCAKSSSSAEAEALDIAFFEKMTLLKNCIPTGAFENSKYCPNEQRSARFGQGEAFTSFGLA